MTKWHGGKGDKPRAKSPDKWDKGWERIFNKAKKKVTKEKIDITKLKNVWEEKSTKKEKQNKKPFEDSPNPPEFMT